jgi:hypothetical protein
MRPSRTATSSASGIDAAEVGVARHGRYHALRGSPSFFMVASMMRMLAWCGISQSIALCRKVIGG